jgi:uncharacterized protein YbjT (DUF2867 family)
MKSKIALVLGATGLVGKELIELLTTDSWYHSIIIINRRKVGYSHPKIQERVIDFDFIDSEIKQISATDVFCCIGTTIKKAGSKEAFRKVDFDIPVAFGKIAEKSGVKSYTVVSSMGANSASSNFYSSVKGEMENQLLHLLIPNLTIVRPSLLLGDRDEKRFGEDIAKGIFSIIGFLMIGPLKKYKPISAKQVAKAMLYYASHPKEKIQENQYLHSI